MFGYIRTDTPELKVRENEYYRAVYCGLCRAQGKCTGHCSRMTLSYDMVFLALLRLAISGERPAIKKGRCMAHPFKKRYYLDSCSSLEYCAYASALLVYGKTADDIADEKGTKRLKAKLTMPFAKGMRKKALKRFESLDQSINQGLSSLSEIENKRLMSVDTPADKFGDILSDILSHGLEGNDATIMKNIGRHIGRWIYIVDAADDHSDDLKNSKYNPFICLFGEQPLSHAQKENIETSLKLELLAAESAFDLLDFNDNIDIEGIIHNIIYRGMPDVAERVLELNGKTKKSTKKNKKAKGKTENG